MTGAACHMPELDTLTEAATTAETLQSLGVLLFMVAGFSLILEAPGIAGRFIFLGFVAIAFSQIGPDVVDQIPLPVLFVVGILILLAVLGQFLALFIGRRAADVAIGNIVANLVTAVVIFMFLPIKVLRKLLEQRE